MTRQPLLRPHDGALARAHRQRAEGALVLRDVGVDQIGEGLRHRRDHVGVAGIDEGRALRVRGAEIDRDLAVPHRHRRAHRDVAPPVAVIVEKGLAVKDALLPAPDLGPRAPLGPVQQRLDGGLDGRRVEALHQRLQARLAEAHRADLGRQVAPEVARMAHIERQHLQQVLARPAALLEAQWRDAQALMEDFGGGGVVGAVRRPADIAVMGAIDRPEGEPPGDEHRREHGHIRQMAAAAGIGIVDDEQIALMHILAEARRDRLRRPGHGADMHRNMLRLGHQPAAVVADGGGEVARGVQDLRIGGAQHRLAHLLDDGRQAVADDGNGDRVRRGGHRDRFSLGRAEPALCRPKP